MGQERAFILSLTEVNCVIEENVAQQLINIKKKAFSFLPKWTSMHSCLSRDRGSCDLFFGGDQSSPFRNRYGSEGIRVRIGLEKASDVLHRVSESGNGVWALT